MDKRYSQDFTVSASYTWSKNLDYASSNGFGGSRGVNNPFNFFFSRGNSDYTRTHRFVNSFVWDLPRLKGKPKADAILGNWRLSSIVTAMSGRPFSIGASNNPIAGAGSARADLIGSGYPILDTGRSKGEKLDAYFDKTRFANPAPNTYRHSRTEHSVRTGFREYRYVAGQGLAPAVHGRAGQGRIPVRGLQCAECHPSG